MSSPVPKYSLFRAQALQRHPRTSAEMLLEQLSARPLRWLSYSVYVLFAAVLAAGLLISRPIYGYLPAQVQMLRPEHHGQASVAQVVLYDPPATTLRVGQEISLLPGERSSAPVIPARVLALAPALPAPSRFRPDAPVGRQALEVHVQLRHDDAEVIRASGLPAPASLRVQVASEPLLLAIMPTRSGS